MKNEVLLCDCNDFMAGCPDGLYDLAIVDPPYGKLLGIDKGSAFTHHRTTGPGGHGPGKKYGGNKNWNKAPGEKYWKELFRVSKNQIICGGNYFSLPPTRDFIVFEKVGCGDSLKKLGRSQCEYIWTSFSGLAKIFKWNTNSSILKKAGWFKIHPTQKPIALYKWLLTNYAKPGWTIFDSHVGSGSIRIACHDLGFDFTGCELDPDYHAAQEERYRAHIQQGELIPPEEIQKIVYEQGKIIE